MSKRQEERVAKSTNGSNLDIRKYVEKEEKQNKQTDAETATADGASNTRAMLKNKIKHLFNNIFESILKFTKRSYIPADQLPNLSK